MPRKVFIYGLPLVMNYAITERALDHLSGGPCSICKLN
jgi:hypothetical protein